MFGRHFLITLGAGVFGLLLIRTAPADTEVANVTPPKGVEVLTRGPIHEAFAEPVEGQPAPAPLVSKEPPAPVEEQPPDQKPAGADVQWIPGYWQWDDDRSDFIWISGFWREPPPGRQWVPGHWDKNDDGWQWVAGYWASTEQDKVTYLPPPPATIDIGPSTQPPDDDSLYVPGVWVYRETRYRWRPGYFIANNPDFVWIPAHYEWTPAGCIFVNGYWDYPLEQRGLLFAPVAFDPSLLDQQDYVYTPDYAVSCDFLPTALFVRPRHHHYYFGDYFGDRDERRGFTPWIDYRIGRFSRDPLFDYYRTNYADRGWERDIRSLYGDRYHGDAALPPRSLREQDRNARNNQDDRTATRRNPTRLNVVTPLRQVDARSVRLEATTRDVATEQRRNATQIRQQAVQRRDQERQIVATNKAPVQITDPPHSVKVDPTRVTTTRRTVDVPPPPARLDAQPGVTRRQDPPAPAVTRHEPPAPPVVHHDAPPPPVTHHDLPPAPPVIHHDAPPAPPVVHHETPPAPPVVHHDAPPPPPVVHHDPPPAPPVMHRDPPPPPPVIHHEPPPAPPVVHHDAPPPPPVVHQAPPAPPVVHAPPPPPPPPPKAPPAPPVVHAPPPPPPPPPKAPPAPPVVHAPPPPPPPPPKAPPAPPVVHAPPPPPPPPPKPPPPPPPAPKAPPPPPPPPPKAPPAPPPPPKAPPAPPPGNHKH